MEFFVPTRTGMSELSEKRSRFIGCAVPVGDIGEAKSAIEAVCAKHRDARHNPWCYILPDGTQRANDDGEPSGTSGPPMLEMLRHENIRGAVVIVTRYFGGVLLGSGGLARAYSAAAKAALLDSSPRLHTVKTRVSFTCSYSLAAQLRYFITSGGGTEENVRFDENVTVCALFDSENADKFCRHIIDTTAGSVTPEISGEVTVPAE